MIFVIATIDLNPGTRDSFLKEFHQIVPLVHAEAGCLEYGPTTDASTDVPTQMPWRADTVTVVEKWESLEHLKAHSVAPHMVAYRPKVKDFVRSVTLQILEPA
jgi:quinol monooxygenase YgiN